MRKLILLALTLAVLPLSGAFAAKPLVAEAPITDYGTPVTVSVSSFTLTQIPTSQTAGRTGIFLDVPSTNTGNLVGHFGNCSAAAVAATIRPLEVPPSASSVFIPIAPNVCLWVITTHTSAENVHYQEVKQ